MKFVNTKNLTNKIKSVSKSRLADHEKCPLMAYNKARDTKPNQGGRALEVGILAHEIAAKKAADIAGIAREVNNVMERFPMDVIYEVQEEIFKHTNFSHLYNTMQIIGVEESVSFPMPDIADNFRFNGRFDCVAYMEINKQKYIVVDDYKTGFQISTDVDTEAIVYAYAAFKHFGGSALPVIFRRIGLRNGKTWSHEFSVDTLNNMESVIVFKVQHWKDEMEGELIPEHTPGSHCLYCPYLRNCSGRRHVDSLHRKYKAAIWAKQYAKALESEVKSAAMEVLSASETPSTNEELVLLPFLGDRYGAVAKTTESYQLKGRKLKKAEIIKMLVETGEIGDYLDQVDIKFNEDLSVLLNDTYKIPMKRVTRTAVSLVESRQEEEDEENE